MLCDNCTHCDVCKYKHTYTKTMEALAWRLKELVVSEEVRSIFDLPDILCTYYSLKLKNISDTLDVHKDDPGEKGFNALISVPPPPDYPFVYRHCPCDDPTIT